MTDTELDNKIDTLITILDETLDITGLTLEQAAMAWGEIASYCIESKEGFLSVIRET